MEPSSFTNLLTFSLFMTTCCYAWDNSPECPYPCLPPPTPPTTTNCPPPPPSEPIYASPPPPAGSGYYYSPPPPGYFPYYPPPSFNLPAPPPPNPILPYFPWYYKPQPGALSGAVRGRSSSVEVLVAAAAMVLLLV